MANSEWATKIFIDQCCSNCACSQNESSPIVEKDNMGRDIIKS